MNRIVHVALDAMGGDHAPDEVVAGAALLSRTEPSIHTTLVGDAARIEPLLEAASHNAERLSIHHAPDAVGMGEPPARALAERPRASVLVAAELVARGEAQALVTAGNTGAAILSCSKSFALQPGIRRAALAAVYPTEQLHGERKHPFALLLDVGATVESSAEDLVAFAIMGAAYSRAVSQNPRPSVALLSNGTEALKGPAAVVRAHEILARYPGVRFIGNVEGVDIPKGTADVVVCDGFTGNVVLKMLEGVGETVLSLARYAHKERLVWRLGLAMLSGGLRRLKTLTDWQQYGGAPILGFDHLAIKAHGRSKALSVANAVKVAARASRSDLTKAIAEGVAQALPPSAQGTAAPG